VAVYDKYTGTLLTPDPTTTGSFFSLTVSSGDYAGAYPKCGPSPPAYGCAFDPRIPFDQRSQRWFACAIDGGSGHVLLAVSNDSDPVGNGGQSWVTNHWTKYLVPFGVVGCGRDFDTLGVDDNGIYIRVLQLCTGPDLVAAAPKGPYVNRTAPQVLDPSFILDVSGLPSGAGGTRPVIQPAVNFDPVAIDQPAWFVAYPLGSNQIYYNRLKWLGGPNAPAQWQDPNWSAVTLPNPSFLSLPGNNIKAPQRDSTLRVEDLNSKLQNAVVRTTGGAQYLWTCQEIGVGSAGDATAADRCAVQWIKFSVSPAVGPATIGRFYDNSSTTKFYYHPSVGVNKNGDLVLGFSSSSANDYISACYTGTLNSGAAPLLPIRYFAGKDWFGANTDFQWGDYSNTCLDPDGLKIWTIQEYAETRYSDTGARAFGTRIAAVTPF